MDFTTMGTVSAYVRQKNLNFAANCKIKIGQKMTDANGILNFETTDVVEAKKKSDDEVGAAKLAGIRKKLASGLALSSDELIYLQQSDPKTYKRAKHAEEAREELRGELKKAKTKQEAKQAVTQAMIKASAKASADISDYKSNSSNNMDDAGEVVSNDLNFSTEKIFADAEYQKLDSEKNYFSWNNEGEENYFSWNDEEYYSDSQKYFDENFYGKENFKNPINNSKEKNSGSPQEIMETFIMTIRAIEAEWAQFTKSKEYDVLPNNKTEADLLNILGEKEKKFYKETEAPNAKMRWAVTAYRNAMMYRDSKIIMEAE